MVNDTNTLNGALQELGETMASNLQAKGVTASASDGLTTLAGKILTIPAGSCYHIEFSEDSYTAVGGSATLEIFLQESYAPKSSATISVTGSDGSVYNGITNSSGIASVTVSDISADTTFTAVYSNVSAVCTVNVVTYYIYDTCDTADGLSNYSNSYAFYGNSTNTLSLNTDEYLLSGRGGQFSGREILALNGVENARLRIKFRLNTTSSGAFNQLWICCDDDAPSTSLITRPYGCRVRNDRLFEYHTFADGTTTVYTHNTVFSNAWFYLEVEKDGTSWTIRLYDANLNQLATDTRTLESMNNPKWYFGLQTERGTNYSVHIKEILAEPI